MNHEQLELEAFTRFVSAARLDAEDIRKREPPAPDIHCVIDGEERAFELVEIAPQLIKHNRKRTFETTQRLQAALDDLVDREPEIGEALRYRQVVIQFTGSSTRQRVNFAEDIFRRGALLAQAGEVEWRPGAQNRMRAIVRRISLAKTEEAKPSVFGSSSAAAGGNDLLDSIVAKLDKAYESDSPVDLLAYYAEPFAPPDSYMTRWLLPGIEEVWATRSIFERLWVCDLGTGWLYSSPY